MSLSSITLIHHTRPARCLCETQAQTGAQSQLGWLACLCLVHDKKWAWRLIGQNLIASERCVPLFFIFVSTDSTWEAPLYPPFHIIAIPVTIITSNASIHPPFPISHPHALLVFTSPLSIPISNLSFPVLIRRYQIFPATPQSNNLNMDSVSKQA